jgi:hypothetical protein
VNSIRRNALRLLRPTGIQLSQPFLERKLKELKGPGSIIPALIHHAIVGKRD